VLDWQFAFAAQPGPSTRGSWQEDISSVPSCC